MHNQSLEQILAPFSQSEQGLIMTTILRFPTCNSDEERRSLTNRLNREQNRAVAEIILLGLKGSHLDENQHKRKLEGAAIRRTATVLLQSLIVAAGASEYCEVGLCDRALKMAQHLHDAT
jgi:hypothetical protein